MAPRAKGKVFCHPSKNKGSKSKSQKPASGLKPIAPAPCKVSQGTVHIVSSQVCLNLFMITPVRQFLGKSWALPAVLATLSYIFAVGVMMYGESAAQRVSWRSLIFIPGGFATVMGVSFFIIKLLLVLSNLVISIAGLLMRTVMGVGLYLIFKLLPILFNQVIALTSLLMRTVMGVGFFIIKLLTMLFNKVITFTSLLMRTVVGVGFFIIKLLTMLFNKVITFTGLLMGPDPKATAKATVMKPPVPPAAPPAVPGPAPGGGAPAPVRLPLPAKAAPVAPVKGGSSKVKAAKLRTPRGRAQCESYLNDIRDVLSEMQTQASELAASAQRDIDKIEREGGTAAAKMIALHALCGSMLEIFKSVPEQLTAQAQALQKFSKVFKSICQRIEELSVQIQNQNAAHREMHSRMLADITDVREKMNKKLKPGQLILLGEVGITLSSLAEKHVYGEEGSGAEKRPSLRDLQELYAAGRLEPEQALRWQQVVQFFGSRMSMDDLVRVDSELRQARSGPAHGYTSELTDTSMEQLQRWARKHYSQEKHPQIHAPLMKMLSMLAEFTSNPEKPLIPNISFGSKVQPGLLRAR